MSGSEAIIQQVKNKIIAQGDSEDLSRVQNKGSTASGPIDILTLATGNRLLGFHVKSKNDTASDHQWDLKIDGIVVFSFFPDNWFVAGNFFNLDRTVMLKGRGLTYSTNVIWRLESSAGTVQFTCSLFFV